MEKSVSGESGPPHSGPVVAPGPFGVQNPGRPRPGGPTVRRPGRRPLPYSRRVVETGSRSRDPLRRERPVSQPGSEWTEGRGWSTRDVTGSGAPRSGEELSCHRDPACSIRFWVSSGPRGPSPPTGRGPGPINFTIPHLSPSPVPTLTHRKGRERTREGVEPPRLKFSEADRTGRRQEVRRTGPFANRPQPGPRRHVWDGFLGS